MGVKKGEPFYSKRRATKEENGITLYQCGKCKEFFPYSGFNKLNRTVLGISSFCKKCDTERNRIRQKEGRTGIKRQTKIENGITLYRCCKCRLFLPHSDFGESSSTVQGIGIQCKKCKRNYMRKVQDYKGGTYIRRQPPVEEDGVILYHCTSCQKYYPKDMFTKRISAPDELSYTCRDCQAQERIDKGRAKQRRNLRKPPIEDDGELLCHCTKCQKYYHKELFVKNETKKQGVGAWCKYCCATATRQNNTLNKEKYNK